LVRKQPGGEVDGNIEFGAALVDRGGCADCLFEDIVSELADAVMLLGRSDEFGCRNGSLLGMSPTGQGFRADDAPALEVELGLIGYPNFTTVDRFVELAEHRQLPRRVLKTVGVVIFPFEPVVSGLVSGYESACEAVGERSATANFDAEGDREVDGHAAHARRI